MRAGAHQATVKYRSTMQPVPVTVERTGEDSARLVFDTPQYGISAGQAAVLYDGDRLLGGGWIVSGAL
jgi:tRNA-specific 2-thiouridylase